MNAPLAASLAVPDTDLHAMVTLLEDARRDEPGEVIPWALLEGLARLIRADSVQLCEVDWLDERLVAQQYLAQDERGAVLGGDAGGAADDYFRECTGFHPSSDPMRPDLEVRAARWSDFYTDRELRNTRAYCEYFAPVLRCVAVRLPSAPGHARRVLFMRESDSASDFTDRDVMVLTLLRPHLDEIVLDAQRRRGGVPRLTDREWEILQLAGAGLSNPAIGQRLFISPATVRKHMENIFERLGVRTRSEAAAIALPHRPRVPDLRSVGAAR